MKVLFEFPLKEDSTFSINVPEGTQFLQAGERAGLFQSQGYLLGLVDPDETKSELIEFISVAVMEEFDPTNLTFLGKVGGRYIFLVNK